MKEGAYLTLASVFDGTWKPGVITLGAAENAVGLPMETSRLESFTAEDYEAMLADIVSGALVIDDQAAQYDPNAKGPWTNVVVDYIQ